jgi:hypothetical protein
MAKGAISTGVRPGVDALRCLDCGARRVDQQVGLELSPDEYVARLVGVFREVRRVLRDDGTLGSTSAIATTAGVIPTTRSTAKVGWKRTVGIGADRGSRTASEPTEI